MTSNINSNRATKKEWIGLAVLVLPTLLLALDMSVLFLALPHLGADLNPNSAQMLWIMDIYAFMIAGFLLTRGQMEGVQINGVEAGAVETVRETLANAVSVAEHLPKNAAADLLQISREAFTIGFNAAAGLSTIIILCFAVFAITILRHIRSNNENEQAAKKKAKEKVLETETGSNPMKASQIEFQ